VHCQHAANANNPTQTKSGKATCIPTVLRMGQRLQCIFTWDRHLWGFNGMICNEVLNMTLTVLHMGQRLPWSMLRAKQPLQKV
jgi:hypothetical protein